VILPRSEWTIIPRAFRALNLYLEKVRRKLATVAISALSSSIGVSERYYAADIRAGRRRLHPRHWQALAEFVGVTESKK